MTFEEVVLKVREGFENADAREIFEHVAVQVDIVGEGSGAFYIEVADRYVSVEPYDYYDRDGLLTADAETLIALAQNRLTLAEAYESGALKVQGNPEKLHMFSKIKLQGVKAKKTEEVPEKESEAAPAKAAAKKTAKETAAKKASKGTAGKKATKKAVADRTEKTAEKAAEKKTESKKKKA